MSACPAVATGCGQYGQGLAVKDRHAERDHCHGDEAVEDAPCGRAGEQAAQPAGAEAQRGEPHRAGHGCPDAEKPTAIPVFVGQRADQYHGVQVDVGVEEGERQAGQHYSGQP